MEYSVKYIVNGQPVTKEELQNVKITNPLFLSYMTGIRDELNRQMDKSELGSCTLLA